MVLDAVRRALVEQGLVSPGETVVVGVSGGADSLCLLHVLCRLSPELGLSPHAAHLDHGLRGVESEADAAFVCDLAAEWGVPCTVERADVPALAREWGLAIEEAARRARYGFLARAAGSIGSRTIAVGHNADDQAETVLMHWLRGAGMAGLRGMLADTPLDEYRLPDATWSQAGLHVIRPLLEVPRAAIEAYCGQHGLEPRFDRSNLDSTYFRNWLRLEVLPMLARHNPKVREVLCRSARIIADDYALLRSLLEETWSQVVVEEGDAVAFDLAAWRTLPTSLKRSTLREAIHRLRRSLRNINSVHVEDALEVACRGTTGSRATLPQGLMLTVGYDRLTVAKAGQIDALPEWPLLPAGCRPVEVQVPGCTPLLEGKWVLTASVVDRDALAGEWEANSDPWRAFLDAAVVGRELWLRTRQAGDRFRPLGLGPHSAKLGDFLTNQKVPRAARDRLPLLVGEGGIAWVCGVRVDERAAVGGATRTVLVCSFEGQVKPGLQPHSGRRP